MESLQHNRTTQARQAQIRRTEGIQTHSAAKHALKGVNIYHRGTTDFLFRKIPAPTSTALRRTTSANHHGCNTRARIQDQRRVAQEKSSLSPLPRHRGRIPKRGQREATSEHEEAKSTGQADPIHRKPPTKSHN